MRDHPEPCGGGVASAASLVLDGGGPPHATSTLEGFGTLAVGRGGEGMGAGIWAFWHLAWSQRQVSTRGHGPIGMLAAVRGSGGGIAPGPDGIRWPCLLM